MNEQDFILAPYSFNAHSGEITTEAPSNIALVKYWGKFKNQIPANPSLSFTLNRCKTLTSVFFKKKEIPSDDFSFEIFFEGVLNHSFRPKIHTFFERTSNYLPFLKEYHFTISSKNTFPHSSGIASSASSMAALSKALMQMEKQFQPHISTDFFKKKASFLARLGSGSACRSLYTGLALWGKHKCIKNSSDLYAIQYPEQVHSIFNSYQNTVLLVDKTKKTVSSSKGHSLMEKHPFAKERFAQAHQHISSLIAIIRSGDLDSFIQIVESEALTLHAMMMSGNPHFILMKPNTLKIIELIWNFRKDTHLPISFTLDAGANVHILYPKTYQRECFDFIINNLLDYCENKNYICDHC